MREIQFLIALLAALASPFAVSDAVAADAEPSDLPEGILAKMKRMELKQHPTHSKKGSNAGEGDDGASCGSLNVGSVSGTKAGSAPREVTVIVKGDIINNPKCR